MMKYKGYIGQVSYDDEAKIFHGEVIGMKDVITFQETTVKELEKAFHDSVDDYIAWCTERGEKPGKTYSGTLKLRIPPTLHAHLVLEAAQREVSLNKLITEKLQKK